MAHGSSLNSRRQLSILLPLLALLLTSLFQGSRGCRAPALCQESCCRVTPNCGSAEKINCFCPHLKELKLGPGDFPPGVHEVSISGPSNLIIQEDAIYNVTSLRDFTLHDIGRVSVENRGLNLHSENCLDYLTVTGVHRSLEVASKAFDARIRTLLLEDVTMDACNGETFDNKIDSVKLSNVTIHNVKTGCFHSVGELGNVLGSGVFVKSSTLGNVQEQAFSGNIPHLELTQETVLGDVAEHGFQLQAKDFKVEKSKINTLNSNGLSVTCSKTFSVADVSIKHLHKNAFRAVKAMSTRTVVSLTKLEVETADPGSFSLPPCLHMGATDLHIQSADIERCPAERWARRLMGLGEHQSPFEDEHGVYLTLRELFGSCDPSLEPPPAPSVQDKSCSASRDENEAKGHEEKREKEDEKEEKRGTGEGRAEPNIEEGAGSSGEGHKIEKKTDEDETPEGIGAEAKDKGSNGGWTAFAILLALVVIAICS